MIMKPLYEQFDRNDPDFKEGYDAIAPYLDIAGRLGAQAGRILGRIFKLIIEKEKIMKFDYKTKCTACGIGFPTARGKVINEETKEHEFYHYCTHCTRRTATYPDDGTKSWEEWCWLQIFCDEVSYTFVSELMAIIPKEDIAIGFHPPKEERALTHINEVNNNLILNYSCIILQPPPKPLTGQAWVNAQQIGTVFEIGGNQYLIAGVVGEHRRIHSSFIGKIAPFCDNKNRWYYWKTQFNELCDEHRVFTPSCQTDVMPNQRPDK